MKITVYPETRFLEGQTAHRIGIYVTDDGYLVVTFYDQEGSLIRRVGFAKGCWTGYKLEKT